MKIVRQLDSGQPVSLHDPRVVCVCDSLGRRILDVSGSLLLIVLTGPLMLAIAALIKLESAGPVLYSQVRVGVNRRRARGDASGKHGNRRRQPSYGRPFLIYKFRSMVVDSEPGGKAVWCKKNDPRVTRLGAILRKTHLDELPQLFNILRGDMSLVGPRPERPEFVTRLVVEVPGYETRLLLKPGLTGLAQVSHRADLGLDDVKKKVRYDRVYLRKASSWTDIKIILATVPLAAGMPVQIARRLRPAWMLNRALRGAVAAATLLISVLAFWEKE